MGKLAKGKQEPLTEPKKFRQKPDPSKGARGKIRQTPFPLTDNEEIFRATFDQAAVGICHVSPDGRYLRVNQYLCDMLGYTPDDFLNLSFQQVALANEVEEDVRLTRKLLSGELNSYTTRTCYQHKDGSIIWVSRKISAARDPSGRSMFYIGVIEDITEFLKAEQALKESEARYALAVKAGDVGVWDWTLKTGEIYIDPLLKNILGYNDQEIPNRIEVWGSLIHPDDRDSFMEAVKRQIKGSNPQFKREHRMIHKDGSFRWFQTNGELVRHKNGKPFRIVGTHRDVTVRKCAEEELRAHHNQLEELVRVRTLELEESNYELRAHTRKLEELNSALRVLVEQIKTDKEDFETKATDNLNKLVLPYLVRLKGSRLTKKQGLLLEIALSNLDNVLSSFISRLSTGSKILTPREIEVAHLVREGYDDKRIAELLCISVRTVEYHRYNVRKKLGLRGKKSNLRSYLISLT